MDRYKATEYNPGMDGAVSARVVSQIDIPRQLLRDIEEGRDVRSGLVEGERDGRSVVTIIWGRTVREDGTRAALAWYEMNAGATVGAPQ